MTPEIRPTNPLPTFTLSPYAPFIKADGPPGVAVDFGEMLENTARDIAMKAIAIVEAEGQRREDAKKREPVCGNCRFWDRDHAKATGDCELVFFQDGKTLRESHHPDWPQPMATISGECGHKECESCPECEGCIPGDASFVYLSTHQDFGCNQFQAREES